MFSELNEYPGRACRCLERFCPLAITVHPLPGVISLPNFSPLEENDRSLEQLEQYRFSEGSCSRLDKGSSRVDRAVVDSVTSTHMYVCMHPSCINADGRGE